MKKATPKKAMPVESVLSPVQDSERYHWASMKRMSGRQADYVRGTDRKPVTVVPYSPNNERIEFGDVFLSPDSKLFLIGTDEIDVPQSRDTIVVDGETWEVRSTGHDGLCWVPNGKYGYAYKIHTHKIRTKT